MHLNHVCMYVYIYIYIYIYMYAMFLMGRDWIWMHACSLFDSIWDAKTLALFIVYTDLLTCGFNCWQLDSVTLSLLKCLPNCHLVSLLPAPFSPLPNCYVGPDHRQRDGCKPVTWGNEPLVICPITHIRTYIRTYIHTHVHTYIHTYLHTYIRTYVCTWYTYIQTKTLYMHGYTHTFTMNIL